MEKVTLEKIDIIRERTGVSYTDAKEALEKCEGNVVDTLVYLEQEINNKTKNKVEEMVTTKEEFKKWFIDLVEKGNATRIKVRKENKVIVDMPVNAGIAAGIFSMIFPPLIGIGLIVAMATKITIEVTKEDGSVEVVNAVIKNTVDDVATKVKEVKNEFKEKIFEKKDNASSNDSSEVKTYSYTVNFENENKDCCDNSSKDNKENSTCEEKNKCCCEEKKDQE